MDKIRKFLGNWQDGLIWLPITILLVVLATWLLPALDPRAGVDGPGFLQGYAVLLMKGVLITFMAWLCKQVYTRDLSDNDETALLLQASDFRNPWPLLIDRLEWVGWILLWYMVLSG